MQIVQSLPMPSASAHGDDTVALLHFDGNITDECGTTWTNTGVTFGAGYFGQAGIFAATSKLTNSYTPMLSECKPFTVELWYRPNVASQADFSMILAGSPNSGTYPTFWLAHHQTFLNWEVGGSSGGWIHNVLVETLTGQAWHHIAVCGDGTTLRLFLNGTLISSVAHPDWGTVYPFQLGNLTGVTGCAGAIDEYRMVVGKALYTANFTPPTLPFS